MATIKLKPQGAKKMAAKSVKQESKEVTPRLRPVGPRRSVLVQLENGGLRNLAAYCKENGISVGTVYLRLKKRLGDNKTDALLLRYDDAVLNAERQATSLKVIAIKDGVVARVRYQDAIQAGADLIISKHGWKENDTQDWMAFASEFPVVEAAEEVEPEASEELEDELLVS